jgi:glucan-binding YG repeat protein
MKKQTAAAVTNAINDKSEEARKDALFEIRSLKKDLAQLEKELSSKKSEIEDPAFDLVHSAFEIFRHTQVMAENRKLTVQIDESLEKASFKDYLDSKGARVLKKPEGWHWISPQGEMHYLGESNETQAAAEKLESLITKRKKPAAKKAAPKKAAPKEEPKQEEKKAAEKK